MNNISINLHSAIEAHNDMNRGYGSSEIAKNAIYLLLSNIDGIELYAT